jgi:hypothetical protein
MAMLVRRAAVAASSIRTSEVQRSTGFTLARGDRGKRIVCSAVFTVTVPSAAVLGTDFSCEILGDGGFSEDDRVTVSLPDDTAFAGRARVVTVFVANGGVAMKVAELMTLP